MTIETAIWYMSLTFTGTDVDLVYGIPFTDVDTCLAAGTRLGIIALEMGDGLYKFSLECVKHITTKVML